jgi:hypothetical protein
VRQRVGVRALFHDCQVTTAARMAARKNEGGRTAMIKCGPRRMIGGRAQTMSERGRKTAAQVRVRTTRGGVRRAAVHARVGTVTDEGGREA